jgi:hypothetical protein
MENSMKRYVCSIALLMMFTGCVQPAPMVAPKKPSPAPELAALQKFTGKWAGSAEMVFPTKEELMQRMPEGSAEPQMTYANGETAAWALGGMHLRRDGWFGMPEGQKQYFVEYVTWDARQKKFRTSMVSDWGDTSTGWMTVSPDGRSAELTTSGYDAAGNLKTGHAMMRFIDADTMEWTWSEKGPQGPFTLRGTNRRR